MKIETWHIVAVRDAIEKNPTPELRQMYAEFAQDIRPKITEAMHDSLSLVIHGYSCEEAATILQVSKAAVSQAAVKGLNRLVDYEKLMGRTVPEALDTGASLKLPAAKPHFTFFEQALSRYTSLE